MERLDAEGKRHFPPNKDGRIRVKRFLDEMPGTPVGNAWDDISPINSQAAERLGYPTQKPEALLERIIKASSNEGDVVLDPFCGCGTAVVAAQTLNRRWVGIDVTHLAIGLIKQRLHDKFGESIKSTSKSSANLRTCTVPAASPKTINSSSKPGPYRWSAHAPADK